MSQQEFSKCALRILTILMVFWNAQVVFQGLVERFDAHSGSGGFGLGEWQTWETWSVIAIVVWVIVWRQADAIARRIVA